MYVSSEEALPDWLQRLQREGRSSVLVIERMDKTGKKILATGNGKCNLTNQAIRRGCISSGVYRSGQEVFPLHVTGEF